MSIQTGEGPLRIDADDLQLEHRGKHIAVKIRVMSWPVIVGCVKHANGWEAVVDLTDEWFANDVPGGDDPVAYALEQYGGAPTFVGRVVLPRLNAWLAEVFPPTGESNNTPLEQVRAAITGLRFVVHGDGTVSADIT